MHNSLKLTCRYYVLYVRTWTAQKYLHWNISRVHKFTNSILSSVRPSFWPLFRIVILGASWTDFLELHIKLLIVYIIAMCMRSQACVCSRSLAGMAGSNSTGNMDVSVLWKLSVVRYRYVRRSDHSCTGVLSSLVCLSVIVKPRKWGDPGPLGAVAP
jgi:hypothetical protein